MRDQRLDAAVKLISEFEGCRLMPYLCPADVATIGYGHALVGKNGLQLKGDVGLAIAKQMYPLGITPEDAQDMLWADILDVAAQVDRLVAVSLTDNERSALVSFTFNLGAGALKNSTLLRRLNQGDKAAVPGELLKWTRGGGRVLLGLVRRRKAEAAVWNAGK